MPSDSDIESAGHLPYKQAQKLKNVPEIKALAATGRNCWQTEEVPCSQATPTTAPPGTSDPRLPDWTWHSRLWSA